MTPTKKICLILNNQDNIKALVMAKVFNSKPKLTYVVLRGRTEANRNVSIAAETTGIIDNIFFEKGAEGFNLSF